MKQQLPRNWTLHLSVVILLFSVGCSLFPAGIIAEWPHGVPSREVPKFSGSFQANLTVANPIVSEFLGECRDIIISDWSVNPTVLLFLYIKNSQNETVEVLPFSHPLNTSQFGTIKVQLDLSNYSIEAHRVANNTFFRCTIDAYARYPVPPSTVLVTYAFWLLGTILILLGVYFTWRLIRRTKEFLEKDFEDQNQLQI